MEKVTYCIHCGKEILDRNHTRCPYCLRKIEVSENVFRYYLYRQVKENVEEKVQDSLYDVLKAYLKAHLYGAVLSLTVVAAIVTGAVRAMRAPKVEILEQEPTSLVAAGQSTASPQETAESEEQKMQEEFDQLYALTLELDEISYRYDARNLYTSTESEGEVFLGLPETAEEDVITLQNGQESLREQVAHIQETYKSALDANPELQQIMEYAQGRLIVIPYAINEIQIHLTNGG